jgi:hypothetical protein
MPQEPDPRLRRVLEQLDETKKQLRAERIRAGQLRVQLDKARRTADAAKQQPEQRVTC